MTRYTQKCSDGEAWSWMEDASSISSPDRAVALSEWVKNCRVRSPDEMIMRKHYPAVYFGVSSQ